MHNGSGSSRGLSIVAGSHLTRKMFSPQSLAFHKLDHGLDLIARRDLFLFISLGMGKPTVTHTQDQSRKL